MTVQTIEQVIVDYGLEHGWSAQYTRQCAPELAARLVKAEAQEQCNHEDFRDTLDGAVCLDCGLEAETIEEVA